MTYVGGSVREIGSGIRTLERIIVYRKFMTEDGKILHTLSELASNRRIRYTIALPDESNVAYILENPRGEFSESKLKSHIYFHLYKKAEKIKSKNKGG